MGIPGTPMGVAASGGVRKILDGEEVQLLHDLLQNGLACFDVYAVTLEDTWRDLRTLDTKCSSDEKDAIEAFANIFASLHPALFTELFNSRMPQVTPTRLVSPCASPAAPSYERITNAAPLARAEVCLTFAQWIPPPPLLSFCFFLAPHPCSLSTPW
jgi:hypothetical protein